MEKGDRMMILPSFFSFSKLKHSTRCFCPAVLGHVFTMKFRLAGFQETEIVASYQIGVVSQNILCPNRFQCILQIQYKLSKIGGVFGIIRIFGK